MEDNSLEDALDQAYIAGQLDMRRTVDEALAKAGLRLEPQSKVSDTGFTFWYVVSVDDLEKATAWWKAENNR